jgi:uncharacterized protein YbaR (Trm112 family)/SAM-dependent methyltransferase
LRYQHFEHFAPICPLCNRDRQMIQSLNLHVKKGTTNWIEEGHLKCDSCTAIYPILRGIPIIVPNVGAYIQQSLIHLLWDTNYSEHHLQWISDASGPTSVVEITRNYLSSYMWSHYGDLDPQKQLETSGLLDLLDETKLNEKTTGPIVDVGCSVGRSTFHLAEKYNQPILGVDLNYSMILHAQEVLLHNRVIYGQRMNGCLYRWKEYPAFFSNTHLVDFWIADATCLPFPDQHLSSAVSLNVMDCTTSPMMFLAELTRVATEFHSYCPYDWSSNVTEYNQWIGGHGSFSQWEGKTEELLHYLLSDASPDPVLRLAKIINEKLNLPWRVRTHDRATMHYNVHYIHAKVRSAEDSK